MKQPLFENEDAKLKWVDIGHEHFISFTTYKDDPRSGLRVRHRRPDGSPCEGFITFEGSAWAKEFHKPVVWQVQNFEPFTCSPSLLCGCGDHGFIRAGKWIPA